MSSPEPSGRSRGRLLALAFALGAGAHLAQILLLRQAFHLGFPGEAGMVLLMLGWLWGAGLGGLLGAAIPAWSSRLGPPALALLVLAVGDLLLLEWLFAVGLDAARVRLGLLPLVGVGLLATGLPGAAAGAALAALLHRGAPGDRPRLLAGDCLGAGAAGVVLGLGMAPGLSPLPPAWRAALWQQALPGSRFLAQVERPDARLVLVGRGGQVAAYADGRLAGWVPDPERERALVLPALGQVAAPRRVLIPAGSLGAPLVTLLAEPVAAVTLVTRDRGSLDALAGVSPELGEARRDPRVRVLEADPRAALRALPEGAYEVVLLPMAEASSAATNRLFTREAFAEMRRLLAPGGVVALTLPAHAGGQASPEQGLTGAVLRALEGAFPGGVVHFGSSPVTVLAGAGPADLEPGTLAARLGGTSLGEDLVVYLQALLDPDEAAAGGRSLARARAGARENRDRAPAAFGAALTGRLTALSTGTERAACGLVLAAWLLGLGIWVLRAAGLRTTARSAAGGATAMIGWGASLYLFQLARGALYREVGLLGAASLAGVALGAAGRRRAPPAGLAALGAGLVLAAGSLPPGGAAATLALGVALTTNMAAGALLAGLLEADPAPPGALVAGDMLGAGLGSMVVLGVVLAGPGPDGAAPVLLLLAMVLRQPPEHAAATPAQPASAALR